MKFSALIAPVLFAVLAVFSFRTVLATPGFVGRTWDWGLPATIGQYERILDAQFFAWDDRIYGGLKATFKNELPFWLLYYPLARVGGEAASKILPLVLVFLGLCSMYVALRKTQELSRFTAVLAACFYGLSPFVYSRVIAGHMTVLLAYALLPLLVVGGQTVFARSTPTGSRRFWAGTVFLAVVTSLISVHLNMAILGAGMLVCVFLHQGMERRSGWIVSLKKAAVLLVVTAVMNAYWIVPLIGSYVIERNVSLRPTETVSEEASRRAGYISSLSQPLVNILAFRVPFGLSTEFVYPAEGLGNIALALAAVTVFGSIILGMQAAGERRMLTWHAVLLGGLILASGDSLLPGKWLYDLLFRFVPSVFAGFSNPLRFLPCVFLAAALLLPGVVQSWETGRNRWLVRPLAVVLFGMLLQPWLTGALTQPVIPGNSQPLSLVIRPLHQADVRLETFLREQPDDFRYISLPPSFLSWPGFSSHSLPWTSGYYPKPVILQYPQEALAMPVYEQLYTTATSRQLARILGLANVRWVVYPAYAGFESYHTFRPGISDYRPYVDANLARQHWLSPVDSGSAEVRIWQNEAALPHIYAADQVIRLGGQANGIVDIVSSPGTSPHVAVITGADNPVPPHRIVIKPVPLVYREDTERIKTLLTPPVRFLPTSPFYRFVAAKEPDIDAVSSVSDMEHTLSLMSKRLEEVRRMLEEKPREDAIIRTAIGTFLRLAELLAGYTRETAELSDADARTLWHVLDYQYRDIQQMTMRTENETFKPEFSSALRSLFDSMRTAETRFLKRITPTQQEFTFHAPVSGQYDVTVPETDTVPQRIAFDGQGQDLTAAVPGERISLGTVTLGEGEHTMQVTYPAGRNLFGSFGGIRQDDPAAPGETIEVLQGDSVHRELRFRIDGLAPERKYAFSFRYRNSGSPFTLAVSAASVSGSLAPMRYQDETFAPNDTWRKTQTEFYPQSGSAALEVLLLLNPTQSLTEYYEFKDISLVEIPASHPVLTYTNTAADALGKPSLRVRKIQPTAYTVSVTDATTPFLLVFAETYHTGWQLRFPDGTLLPSADHFPVNGFANAWIIDRPGTYDMSISFAPQRVMSLGLGLAAVAWSFAGLAILWWSLGKVRSS